MIKKIIVPAILMATSTLASAGGAIDFSLANDSIRVEHDAVLVGTGAHVTTGFLYNEEESNWAVTAGFNAVDATMANQELIGGVGFKGLLISSDVKDIAFGAGVGGFFRWQPDFMNGLGLEGEAYLAPSILSFGDLTYAHELVGRVTYKVLPQARVFVGYHDITANYEQESDVKIDSTFHLGFRMTY